MNQKIKKMLQVEVGVLIVVVLIIMVLKTNLVSVFPRCSIYHMFGVLCPSCGGTRCMIHFVLGNWKESFYYHSVFFVTILYFLFVNILYVINAFRKKEILTILYPTRKFLIIFLFFLLLYTIVRNLI